MKVISTLLILSFVALSTQKQTYSKVTKEWYAEIELHKSFCLDQYYVPDELIERVVKYADFADGRSIKCFTKCTLTKLDAINESGEISEEGVRRVLKLEDKELEEKVVQKCKDIKENDVCETAYSFAKCVIPVIKKALEGGK